jgi:transcriptional regulator with GAF, ATPase, and Fis domain
LQGKLLRVLQEGQFERVGDEATRKVDVRVIAATNRNLQEDAGSGRFRRDLFYRLSVFPIVLPPLRDRLEDLPRLATYFIEQAARRYGKSAPQLTVRAQKTLQAYSWPGNVRELQHVIERAVLLSPGRALRVDDVLAAPEESSRVRPPSPGREAVRSVIPEIEWQRREQENVRTALQLANGRIYGPEGAAELLGLKPTTLISRLKALGLRHAGQRANRTNRTSK